jgi:hypothetical protein
MKAIAIYPTSTLHCEYKFIEPTLEEMQKAVGGHIEYIDYSSGQFYELIKFILKNDFEIVCNEEFLFIDEEFDNRFIMNEFATTVTKVPIKGPVVFVSTQGEETLGFQEEELNRLEHYFNEWNLFKFTPKED